MKIRVLWSDQGEGCKHVAVKAIDSAKACGGEHSFQNDLACELEHKYLTQRDAPLCGIWKSSRT